MRQIFKDFADGAAVAFAVIAAILLLIVAPSLLIVTWAQSAFSIGWAFVIGMGGLMTYFGGMAYAFVMFADRKGWRPLGLVAMPPPPPSRPPENPGGSRERHREQYKRSGRCPPTAGKD